MNRVDRETGDKKELDGWKDLSAFEERLKGLGLFSLQMQENCEGRDGITVGMIALPSLTGIL